MRAENHIIKASLARARNFAGQKSLLLLDLRETESPKGEEYAF
jgi:hypothetical protein